MEAAAKTISSTGSSASANAAEPQAKVKQRTSTSARIFFIDQSPFSNINEMQFVFYCNSKYTTEKYDLQQKTI